MEELQSRRRSSNNADSLRPGEDGTLLTAHTHTNKNTPTSFTMCVSVCVCYLLQLVLQGSVFHVVVDETHRSGSFTDTQQIYNVRMPEPKEQDALSVRSHDHVLCMLVENVETGCT